MSNISNVKLIASDLDGTLLRGGAQSITPRELEIIRAVLDKDIIFVPASGRQCESLKRLFRLTEMTYQCFIK